MANDFKIQENKQYLRELSNAQQKTIAAKEKQLQQLNKSYKESEKEMALGNALRIDDKRRQNHVQLMQENEKTAEKLEDLGVKYQKTLDRLDNELKFAKQVQQQQMAERESDFASKYAHRGYEHSNLLDQQQSNASDSLQNLHEQTKTATDKLRLESNQTVGRQQLDNEKRVHEDALKFKQAKDFSLRKHNKDMTNLQRQQLQDIHSEQVLHDRKFAKIQDEHISALSDENAKFDGVLYTTKNDFEKKYADLLTRQKTDLLNMNNYFQQEFQKVQAGFNSQKAFYSKRAEDPFYRTVTMKSQVVDHPKKYEVKVPIPEHEKNNVQVSANKRDIKLTINRRYEGELENAEDQTLSSAQKYEVITKRFPVAEIVDPNGVEKSYKDGAVHFFLKKA